MECVYGVYYKNNISHTVNIAGIYLNQNDAIIRVKNILGAHFCYQYNFSIFEKLTNIFSNGKIMCWINKYNIGDIKQDTICNQPTHAIPILYDVNCEL